MADDRYLFYGIAVALVAWFVFLYDAVEPFATNNYMVFFPLFMLALVFLVSKFIIGIDVFDQPQKFVAYLLIFSAFTIIGFPLLVPKSGAIELSAYVSMGADYWVYKLLPTEIPHLYRFYFTYIVAPLLLLVGARALLTEKSFQYFLKDGLR